MEQPIIKHVFGNLMRIAIPLTIRIRTMVDGHEQETEEDFYPDTNFPVAVRFKNQYGITRELLATMEGNVATASDEGTLQIGIYNVEVVCRGTDGHPYRFMVRQKVQVVDATIDAGIESGIEFDAETYTIEGAVFFYAKGDKGDRGVSIASIEQIETSEESGGTNIIRVTLDNGEFSDFTVMNGKKPEFRVEGKTLILS